MPVVKTLTLTLTALGVPVLSALGAPLLTAEEATLPAPDTAGWRADAATLGLDPATASPREVAEFFAALNPAQRTALALRHPEVVAALDGAPASLRFTATSALRRSADQRTFLAYDPAGDGRAVEVVGDLVNARRIVVIVPGSDTTLADFDRGLGGVARRAPAVQARTVADAVDDPGTAVVAWLGYDPPEGFGKAAVREDRAEAGAAALTKFVEGLAVTNPAAKVILVGHSYGTVVIGLAAPHLGPTVTDIAVLASPGLGDGFHTTARLWAARADSDWIGWIPGIRVAGLGHGADPTGDAYGARLLPTGNVDGHDGYLVPGSLTLVALAEVIRNA
ncbi:alpha/beta hydrolase [Hamadaea sp. NPDC050747]|uniref:alpha/beta hydrolase n=1 Tax=Hamadaea sp. NPDC050747 TaxID=3155789 RepID=UPI0033DBB264